MEDRSDENKEESAWLSSSAKDPDEDPFAGAFDEPVPSKVPAEEKVGFGVGLSTGATGVPGAIDDDKTDFDFGFDTPPGEDEKEDEPLAPVWTAKDEKSR